MKKQLKHIFKAFVALIIVFNMLLCFVCFAETEAEMSLSYETNADLSAKITATIPDSGDFTLTVNQDDEKMNFYTLNISTDEGFIIKSFERGAERLLHHISTIGLYEVGVSATPNKTYSAELWIHKGRLEFFIDGVCVISFNDSEPPQGGKTFLSGSEGVVFEKFEVGAPEVVSSAYIVDGNGDVTDTIVVPVGNFPEFKRHSLVVEYIDGKKETVPFDKTTLDSVNFSIVGETNVFAHYKRFDVPFTYKVINRTELTEQINTRLSALEKVNLSALSDENVAEIKEVLSLYNSLSYIEKQAVTKTQLLTDLEDALAVHLYPELKGAKVVYKDSFDSIETEANYENHVSFTGDRNSGYWYIENGAMYQYCIEDAYRSGSFAARNILKNKKFEINSVSVDVKVIDPNVFLGLDACFGDNKFFEFYITDKTNVGGGNRIQLYKNGTMIAGTVETDSSKWFRPDVWYNLTLTLDNGVVRCYVDGELKLEAEEPLSTADEEFLTTGTVGMRNTEGWGIFDNLTVRGKELPYVANETPKADLTPGSFSDSFEDEAHAKSPSHWIENNKEDKWTVQAGQNGKTYSLKDNLTTTSSSWLHVFETDVDFTAKLKATELGSLPIMGLSSRMNGDGSYIKAGYDFTKKMWFIKVKLGYDFEETVIYSEKADVELDKWYTIRLTAVDKALNLYVNNVQMVLAGADRKVMPGRVGIFAERCNLDVDDVSLKLLSGQGRVNDGVLEYELEPEFGVCLGMMVLPDGRYYFFSDGDKNISEDKGQTLTQAHDFTSERANTAVQLPDGKYLHIKNYVYAYTSEDFVNWELVGNLPIDPNSKYAQPADRINIVKLDNGTYRVFHTVGKQSNVGDKSVVSETYYSDDGGYTWTQSKNSPLEYTALDYFCETQIIKIKDGPLIQYCSYNDGGCMRYSLSYDNGESWVGEFALPQIPCSLGSFSVKEDPYDEGVFYMSTLYNPPYNVGNNRPRHRIALMRSYDGINWEFLADIDRWGDVSDGVRAEIMQNVNMRISFSDEYIFPAFSHSEQYLNHSSGHNLQIGKIYRFDKSKLEAYDEWPQEYVIDPKAITSIEAIPETTKFAVGDSFDEDSVAIKVNHYDGTSSTVALSNTVYTKPDMTTPGLKKIAVDYNLFRTIFTIQVGEDGEWVNPFEDVETADWFNESVGFAYTNGLVNGTSESTFAPNSKLTRGMLVTLLWRAENKPMVIANPGFVDLEDGQYYVDAVKWAARHGIVNGVSDGEFAPDMNVTREQIAAIMYRYATYKGIDTSVGEDTNILSYDDFSGISEYAIPAMQYACGSGLIKGKSESTLNPQDNATRAEISAILHRFITNK